MSRGLLLRILGCSALLAGGLTWFFFVHEQLPRSLRAPTSLLLAPIAVVDGLCYAAGMRGVYGKIAPMFLVNLLFLVLLLGLGLTGGRFLRRRRS